MFLSSYPRIWPRSIADTKIKDAKSIDFRSATERSSSLVMSSSPGAMVERPVFVPPASGSVADAFTRHIVSDKRLLVDIIRLSPSVRHILDVLTIDDLDDENLVLRALVERHGLGVIKDSSFLTDDVASRLLSVDVGLYPLLSKVPQLDQRLLVRAALRVLLDDSVHRISVATKISLSELVYFIPDDVIDVEVVANVILCDPSFTEHFFFKGVTFDLFLSFKAVSGVILQASGDDDARLNLIQTFESMPFLKSHFVSEPGISYALVRGGYLAVLEALGTEFSSHQSMRSADDFLRWITVAEELDRSGDIGIITEDVPSQLLHHVVPPYLLHDDVFVMKVFELVPRSAYRLLDVRMKVKPYVVCKAFDSLGEKHLPNSFLQHVPESQLWVFPLQELFILLDIAVTFPIVSKNPHLRVLSRLDEKYPDFHGTCRSFLQGLCAFLLNFEKWHRLLVGAQIQSGQFKLDKSSVPKHSPDAYNKVLKRRTPSRASHLLFKVMSFELYRHPIMEYLGFYHYMAHFRLLASAFQNAKGVVFPFMIPENDKDFSLLQSIHDVEKYSWLLRRSETSSKEVRDFLFFFMVRYSTV